MTHPEESIMSTLTRIAAAAALALAALAAGCTSVERHERALALDVRTTPPGAAVTAAIAGREGEARKPLGKAPLTIPGLVIVRKVYPNGTKDYWLYDGAAALPANSAKPSYATPAYTAGALYPLD